MARLPESEGQLRSAFSESSRTLWCPVPANRAKVEFAIVGGEQRRVLDAETVEGATGANDDLGSTRYQLQELSMDATPVVPTAIDFDEQDFDTVADFL